MTKPAHTPGLSAQEILRLATDYKHSTLAAQGSVRGIPSMETELSINALVEYLCAKAQEKEGKMDTKEVCTVCGKRLSQDDHYTGFCNDCAEKEAQ